MKAETVRAVLFSSTAASQNLLTMWGEVSNDLPVTFQQAAQPGSAGVAMGPLGKFQAVLASQSNRIDLGLLGPDLGDGNAPVIPSVDAALSQCLSAARKLTGIVKPNRLALIVELFEPADDADAALQLALADLPGVAAPAGSLDFIYQVNKRVGSSAVPGVEINRLCKWYTAQKQLVQLQVGGSGAQTGAVVLRTTSTFSLGLDFNTVPVGTVFGNRQANLLLGELVKEAKAFMAARYAYIA